MSPSSWSTSFLSFLLLLFIDLSSFLPWDYLSWASFTYVCLLWACLFLSWARLPIPWLYLTILAKSCLALRFISSYLLQILDSSYLRSLAADVFTSC